MSGTEHGGPPPYDLTKMDVLWVEKRRGIRLLSGFGQLVIEVERRFEDEEFNVARVELNRAAVGLLLVGLLNDQPFEHHEDARRRLTALLGLDRLSTWTQEADARLAALEADPHPLATGPPPPHETDRRLELAWVELEVPGEK